MSEISFTDRPFGAPLDIVLDLPVPPSVNKTRRINTKWIGKTEAWRRQADLLLMSSGQYRAARKLPGRFEVKIILCERQCRLDIDNTAKSAIDYLKRIELVSDDSPKFMRRLVIEFGDAPAGCRIILKEVA